MRPIIGFCVIVMWLLPLPIFSQARPPEQPADPLADFSQVEKPTPVREFLRPGFESITGADALALIRFLSADCLQGRETAETGYDVAAEYVASLLSLWNVRPAGDAMSVSPAARSFARAESSRDPQPGYFQVMAIKEVRDETGQATGEWIQDHQRRTRIFYPGVDYLYSARDSQSLSAAVVFVGYGVSEKEIGFDEYKGVDVSGKIVLMLSDLPAQANPRSPFRQDRLREKYAPAMRMRDMGSPKIRMAKDRGALAVLMVDSSLQPGRDLARRVLQEQSVDDSKLYQSIPRRRLALAESLPAMPWETVPAISISRQMADALLGFSGRSLEALKETIENTSRPSSFELPGLTLKIENTVKSQLLKSRNVLGMIEGGDPLLKDEVVVIGAHLDHLGKRGDYIFNGADDNASGAAGLLEIARAFALNPVKPKRSVLFAFWTGEEQGLLGSRFYVSHPRFALKKTVAYLNLDMISRPWSAEQWKTMSRIWNIKLPDEISAKFKLANFLLLSLAADSPRLHDALKASNEFVGLTLYLRRSERMMAGSDHAAFALNKIPWAFFFASSDEDYHGPADTADRLNGDLIQAISRLVYLTAFRLADLQP